MGAGPADRGAGRLSLVRAQIVENDDVAAGQGGSEELLDIVSEQHPIHRAVEDARRLDPVAAQGGDGRAAMAGRRWQGGDGRAAMAGRR